MWVADPFSEGRFPEGLFAPMPSGNKKGCLRRELRYDTACALQKRVMDVLVSDGQRLSSHGTGQFWSPHSGGVSFFPSASAALNVEKSDRDMLGGWTAQESDRYNRVARVRIQALQALVTRTFSDQNNHEKAMPSKNSDCSCRSEEAAKRSRLSTSRRFPDAVLFSSLVSKTPQKKVDWRERTWERCNSWKKMRLRRSWQQRKERTDEGDNKLGMPTDLHSWEANPKKHTSSSTDEAD